MLTGDKRETAINIAQSSAIVKPGMKVMMLFSSFYSSGNY
jgi:magnesium-transporting ATPase (P-type)